MCADENFLCCINAGEKSVAQAKLAQCNLPRMPNSPSLPTEVASSIRLISKHPLHVHTYILMIISNKKIWPFGTKFSK